MASLAIGVVIRTGVGPRQGRPEQPGASVPSSTVGLVLVAIAIAAGCDGGCGPISDRHTFDGVECAAAPTGRTSAPNFGYPLTFSAQTVHWEGNQITSADPIPLDGHVMEVTDQAGRTVAGRSEVVDRYRLLFHPTEPLTTGVTYSARASDIAGDGCAWSFTPAWPGNTDPSWSRATLDSVRALDLALPSGGGALILAGESSPRIVLHRTDDSGALDGAVSATAVVPNLPPDCWVVARGSLAAGANGTVLLAGQWTGAKAGWWAQQLDAAAVPSASFGVGGAVIVEEPSWSSSYDAYGVRILPAAGGAALVVLGGPLSAGTPDDAVVRLLADGTPDPGFGAGGRLDPLPGDGSPMLWSVLSTAGGGVVAVSQDATCGARLARYGFSGSLDSTFGDAGTLCVASVAAPAAALDAEDRILVAGSGPNDTTTVVRRLPGGQPDAAFGQAGVTSIPGSYRQVLVAARGERVAMYRTDPVSVDLARSTITILDDAGAILREELVGDDYLVAGLAVDGAGRTFVLGTLESVSPTKLVLERLVR